jgi:hypothetical protein
LTAANPFVTVQIMPKNRKNSLFIILVLIVFLAAGYLIFVKPRTSVPTQSQTGMVSGRLCYPSQVLPKGKIVAKNIQTGETIIQDYPGGEMTFTYTFELKPGEYHLRYDVVGPEGGLLSEFYTNYSDCALADTCGERKTIQELLPVKVESGKKVENIHLCDFIYPANKIDF